MQEDLKKQVIEAVNVVDFIRQFHPKWSGSEQEKLACPLAATRHEGGDDSSPSLSINPVTGEFNCYGCGWKGTSILGYYTDVKCEGNFKKALASLFSTYIRPTIAPSFIKERHKNLLKRSSLMQKIAAIRGWDQDTIRRLKIGWDTDRKRTVIPIFNLQGYCLDVRYHDSVNRAPLDNGKRIPCLGSTTSRSGDFYPLSPVINPFKEQEIWIVEGEPDAILATQDGLNCITVTGGAGAWSALDYERLKVFAGKDVIICLDADKAGQDAARKLSERLAAIGLSSLKNCKVPEGKDITDYFLRGGDSRQLRIVANQAQYLIKPTNNNGISVPLSETGRAEYIGKTIKTNVILSGKADAPQAVPNRLKLQCYASDGVYCDKCPCKVSGEHDYFVDKDSPDILEWLYCKDVTKRVKSELGITGSCCMKTEVVDWQNIESVTLIPALSNSAQEDQGHYTTRRGYYLGHGIESNQNYTIKAMPAVHPRTKESVLLVIEARGAYDSIAKFQLTAKEVKELKELFTGSPQEILTYIARQLSSNVTKIYGRSDLHIAVDLAYHSPSRFYFSGSRIPKGSMELLIFGDTRCGKGQVAEGLVRYYDLGSVVSGENASFMGLCGGAIKSGDSFQLSWGAIPINNGRIVVIDEFSGLDASVLGKLSRIRSEGIAEINKGGINTKTDANTRLAWIANPKYGREVGSFSSGVAAIMDLIGTNEDVARFDLAVVVQKNEVDIHDINKSHTNLVPIRYSRDVLRKIILWIWSRTEDQIVFTDRATTYILDAANRLADMYSPTIPLIQGENARFKIAKIAAAIAGRVFSTDDGIHLKVTEEHAKLAVKLINKLYSKPSMGYRLYSAVELGASDLADVKQLDDFFKRWPAHIKRQIINGMLTVDKFGNRELQDWCDVDGMVAKKFVGMLVRCQAVKLLAQGMYAKKPSFIKYLKKLKETIE